ncbi:MAG: UDP-glucose--hexose-1-phosphate uridylyltransferase, partial [Collinsella sp.]|nr:UDP-glucose--hexose-1-phosphate uridylyltransferase [Collinsella sp.]
ELGAVREHLLAAKADVSYDLAGALEGDDLCRNHAAWAKDVFARRADELTADSAIDILHEEVGMVFGHVLDNAGVFKWDEAGRAAQQRFIDSL